MGIANFTNVTSGNITDLINFTSPMDFFVNVNQIVYGGWLWFVLMSILFVILFVSAQQVKDQILNNLMYAGAACSILSFILRGIYMTKGGIQYALMNDYQLWIFPLITLIIIVVLWTIKD